MMWIWIVYGFVLLIWLVLTIVATVSEWDYSSDEDRKWMCRAILVAPIWPLIVVIGLSVLIYIGIISLSDVIKKADLKNIFKDIRDEIKDED